MTRNPEVVEPLQTVLAAEHAVIYGYGVVGVHLRGADRTRAADELARHRRQRDELTAQLVGLRAEPAQTAAAYALPQPVTSPDEARGLAAVLEARLAGVWADAVLTLPARQAAEETAELREQAIAGLRAAAVAAALWRGGSVPFPGLTEWNRL